MLEKMFELIAKSGLFKPILSLLMLSTVILFLPNLVMFFGMQDNFINEYKNIIVLIFGYSFFMVLFTIIYETYRKFVRFYIKYRNSDKQRALRYFKKSLTPDQREFINEKFFDAKKNKYIEYAKIYIYDERGSELERNKVVKRGKECDDEGYCCYTLLSYSQEFFNNKR